MVFYLIVKCFHKGSYLKYGGYIKVMEVHQWGCQMFIVIRVNFKNYGCFYVWSMDISSELKNTSLRIIKIFGDWKYLIFCSLVISWCITMSGSHIFLRCSLFVAVFFFFGADFFLGAGFLEALFIFFGKVIFLGVAFFLGESVFFSAKIRLFINYGDSLYELLIWMKLTEAMTDFNPDRKVAFNHFLYFGRSACNFFKLRSWKSPCDHWAHWSLLWYLICTTLSVFVLFHRA